MPPKKIRVCQGPHCSFRGSARVMEELENSLHVAAGSPTPEIDLNFCACTTYCDDGPNVVVNDEKIYHHSKTRDIAERIAKDEGVSIIPPTFEDLKLDELL